MKVVIIGLGSIAKKHISALRIIDPFVDIVAYRSSASAERVDGVRNIFSWQDILYERPDFIIVSNPTALHFNALQKIKDFQIPLFIEKPLFDKLGVNEKSLVKAFKELGTPTYVACNLRFLHALQRIKELLENERINEVNVYCGSYLPDWRPGLNFRNIYSANKEMGGGVHLDLVHELDYLYWIFGQPIDTKITLKNNSSLHISAYDYANYLWEYKEFCISTILNYYRPVPKRSMEIICDSGIYNIDILKNSISRNDMTIFSSNQQIKDTYKDQLLFFIDNILTKKVVFNPMNEGYNILKLCLKE